MGMDITSNGGREGGRKGRIRTVIATPIAHKRRRTPMNPETPRTDKKPNPRRHQSGIPYHRTSYMVSRSQYITARASSMFIPSFNFLHSPSRRPPKLPFLNPPSRGPVSTNDLVHSAHSTHSAVAGVGLSELNIVAGDWHRPAMSSGITVVQLYHAH
jgi:hypothetical protein